jgi:hypothetical protein
MSDDKTGRFLGLPYDLRRPTWQRIKLGVWNPDDSSIFPRRRLAGVSGSTSTRCCADCG